MLLQKYIQIDTQITFQAQKQWLINKNIYCYIAYMVSAASHFVWRYSTTRHLTLPLLYFTLPTVLFSTTLYSIQLFYTTLFHTTLHSILPYSTPLYRSILHSPILFPLISFVGQHVLFVCLLLTFNELGYMLTTHIQAIISWSLLSSVSMVKSLSS